MSRYLIYGNESPEAIERTVTEVLAQRGLKVHDRTHWEDHPYWDDFVLFSMHPENTDAANSAGLWVDLRTRSREPIEQIVQHPQKTKGPVNYEITIAPTGYGSAVERGAECRAKQLDQLCDALVPLLKDAQVYKSHGIGGTDFLLME